MMKTVKIKKQTKVDAILDIIRSALISGELIPGSKLPSEREMCEQFGVGKSSVREVIKMLDAVGVVESIQGKGVFVSTQDKPDSLNPLIFSLLLLRSPKKDLLQFRESYERMYTHIALDNATPEDLAHIEKQVVIHEKKSAKSKNCINEDVNFHKAVLYSTHNQYIIKVGEILLDLFRITLIQNESETLNQEVIIPHDVHRRILSALKEKSHKKLNIVLTESFALWENFIL